MPRLLVVVASTRPGRAGGAIGTWFTDIARAHSGFEVDVADLAELDLPFHDEPAHPRLGQYEHEHTKRWSAQVDRRRRRGVRDARIQLLVQRAAEERLRLPAQRVEVQAGRLRQLRRRLRRNARRAAVQAGRDDADDAARPDAGRADQLQPAPAPTESSSRTPAPKALPRRCSTSSPASRRRSRPSADAPTVVSSGLSGQLQLTTEATTDHCR